MNWVSKGLLSLLSNRLSRQIPLYFKLFFPEAPQRGDTSANRARARTSKVLISVATVPAGSRKVKHTFTKSCLCCRRAHKSEDCPEFRQITLKERKLLVGDERICFKCLSQGHMAVDCSVSSTCGRVGCTNANHHTLLHVNKCCPGPLTLESRRLLRQQNACIWWFFPGKCPDSLHTWTLYRLECVKMVKKYLHMLFWTLVPTRPFVKEVFWKV